MSRFIITLLLSVLILPTNALGQNTHFGHSTSTELVNFPSIPVNNNTDKYPDGSAGSGIYSYKGGDFETWQRRFKGEFITLMGIDPKLIDSPKSRQYNAWIKKFVPPQDKKHPFNTLLRPAGKINKSGFSESTNCPTEDHSGRPLAQQYYPPRFELKKDHMILYACASDTVGIRVYNIVFEGYQGKLLSALLFIPNETKANLYERAGGKVPTLIFHHGHEANKYQASFNPNGYMHGVAYHAALNGFVVLAPDVRGFAESKDVPKLDSPTDHQNIANKTKSIGSNFYAFTAMDAIYAQDFLEISDMRDFGLKREIDTGFNMIAGVSMGGRIALFASALDERFEVASMHGIFLGHEVLDSKFHCSCGRIPALSGKFNVFDVAQLISPRTLHVAMGGRDAFFNNYAKSAIQQFATNLAHGRNAICHTNSYTSNFDFLRNDPVRSRFISGLACPLVLEIDPNAKHELIGLGNSPHRFWQNYLNSRR